MTPPRHWFLSALAGWLTLAGPAAAGLQRADWSGDELPPGALARLGTERFRHPARVLAASFSPDGKQLLSVASNGGVRLWDVATGKEDSAGRLELGPTTVVAAAWPARRRGPLGAAQAADGSGLLLATAVGRQIRLWDGRAVRVLQEFTVPKT
jgi:WD40 repeat protein